MIKLESIYIEEFRGIRKLALTFGQATFAISGPNGSGKSGVIDAIEFGLTGEIGRLAGRGTKGLSVSEHGPHVDKARFPDAAFVRLAVFLPTLGKSATITRRIAAPHQPTIEPPDDDIKAVLRDLADHPEITLSRREILRFILVEPSKRSEEIQSLLRLDQIGQLRSALSAAKNKLGRTHRFAEDEVRGARVALQRHLQIATLLVADVLLAVNKRRAVLGLASILSLTADSTLDADLVAADSRTAFNKHSALRDIQALLDWLQGPTLDGTGEVRTVLSCLTKLDLEPALLTALKQRELIERGIELLDGPECPLCDRSWDEESQLRNHLRAKVVQSEQANGIRVTLLQNGASIAAKAVRLIGVLVEVRKHADSEGAAELAQQVATWRADLDAFRTQVDTFAGLFDLKGRLSGGWMAAPEIMQQSLVTFAEQVRLKPDQSTVVDAKTFLITAQLRLGDLREARRKSKAAHIAATAASASYDTYCAVSEAELNALYDDVEEEFSAFYRALNEDDESTFTATLTPSEGTLALDVNFYERGLFPPGAYHSEGHQDGMGVCLYLALMERLFGDGFTFALLDDVVMSVDSDHRYQFCKLLKTHFSNTQFVITTHDRLWAEQMRSAGLISSKTSVVFQGWTIDTGPLVESNEDIWQEITTALAKGKVPAAAAALRHHLEYASRILADELRATPPFRADGNYELGDLLPSVLTQLKTLYGKAADAAQSWGRDDDKQIAVDRKSALSSSNGSVAVEQWAVNKAVHYNEWANFGKQDFVPVVAAFKELLECCSCEQCHSWIYLTPRVNPDSLRCSCNAVSLNLKRKSK